MCCSQRLLPSLDEPGHDLGPPLLTESLLIVEVCPRLAVLRLFAPWSLKMGIVVVGGVSHLSITLVLDFELEKLMSNLKFCTTTILIL